MKMIMYLVIINLYFIFWLFKVGNDEFSLIIAH